LLSDVAAQFAFPTMTAEERAEHRRDQNAFALERYRKASPFGAAACVVLSALGSMGQSEGAAWTIRAFGVTAAVVALLAIPLTRARGVVVRPNALFFAVSLPISVTGGLVAAYTGGFESAAIATVTLLWVFGSVVTLLSPLEALLDAVGQLFAATLTIVLVSPHRGSPVMFAAINAFGVALLFAGMALRQRADQEAFLVKKSLDVANRRLANMNVELESRVSEQVAEIKKRAQDIEALNAQLQHRVIERSRELAVALARLSRSGPVDGPLVGTVLNGRLEIVRSIDTGGMGEVFEAVDTITRSRVAVKTIHSQRGSDVVTLQRFLTEARAAAAVRHDAIVRTLDVDVTPTGTLFHVMELLEGQTFADWMVRAPSRPVRTIVRVGHVVADALAAAHASGLVHRDIKPSNIMLVANAPGAKIFDFGVAKLRDQAPEDDLVRTHGYVILGTPAYMAPEQVKDPGSVGPPSDIYSLGVVLYEALSLMLPHPADTAAKHLAAIMTTPPVPLSACCKDVPTELADLVMRCLAREPTERPSAATLARELQPFLESTVELGREDRPVHEMAATLADERTRKPA
jgi:tRNA A-37 threonylcarbamoyl transferase component Bud32